MRVINAARSPNAVIYVTMKFGIDTPYEKIAIFRSAVEQFLKDRPREWLTFIGFRPTEVVVDQAYIGTLSCTLLCNSSADNFVSGVEDLWLFCLILFVCATIFDQVTKSSLNIGTTGKELVAF